MSTPNPPASVIELQRRLVFSLLRPAVRLCRCFGLPLKQLEELARLAYYEELKQEPAATQAELARLLDLSLRTIGNLERQHRGDFLAPAHALALTRQAEEALDQGPLTAAEVAERVPDLSPADAARVLAGLTGAGRARRLPDTEPPRFELNRSFVSLYRNELQARIDGLDHQLEVVVNAVRARFLEEGRPSAARTLSFVASAEGMTRLIDELIRLLRERCSDTEEEALRAGAYERYGVTLAVAPMDGDRR